MKLTNQNFRHILLYYFRKGKNSEQVAKKLCEVYGDEASCEIGLSHIVLQIFYSKMSNVEVNQVKLMVTILRL